jgi:cell volume regulation protein A
VPARPELACERLVLLEAEALALTLLAAGVLMALAALLSPLSRLGVPAVLLFLLLGMLAGSEGIGRIRFEDYSLTFALGTVALIAILFDGGLNTPMPTLRRTAGPALVLAVAGVLATALLVGLGARLLRLPWAEALLLGAIVSSTDAAAVFSVVSGAGLRIRERVAATVEIESSLNDPMAVILTTTLTGQLPGGKLLGAGVVVAVAVQLLVGAATGLAVGAAGRWLLPRMHRTRPGLHPVLTLALAFVAFALAAQTRGSGFLAVYVAGIVIGNGRLPYRAALLRIHDFLAWVGQTLMFLALGLLVLPSRLVAVAGTGTALALMLVLIARPVVTIACLAPFRYRIAESIGIAWLGLRGAVPIVLATFPVLSGVAGAGEMFDLVFFVVVVSALLQGTTSRPLLRRLRVATLAPPEPPAAIEISSRMALHEQIVSYRVATASAVCGARIADVPFPPDAAVVLLVRGEDLVAPKGGTEMLEGDHVFVFCRPEDKGTFDLLFGKPLEES